MKQSTTTPGRLLGQAMGGKPDVNAVVVKRAKVALVDSNGFTLAVSAIVFLNVVCIGAETEMNGGGYSHVFSFLNNSFLLIYLVEICFRLLTHGMKAFHDFITVLDVLLVLGAFIEGMASSRGMARSLPTLRLCRLFRVLRSSKALRLSRELWVMVKSARMAVTSLFWMSIVLFLLLWALAGFATDAIGNSSEWAVSLDPSLDNTYTPFRPFDVHEYFGSISRSFFTLFQVMTLSQWSDVARPLINVYPVLGIFFCAFLFATTYGLLVTVIANLVVDSMVHSRENKKAVEESQRETRRKAGKYAMHMLALADRDGDGQLDIGELTYALEELGLEEVLIDLGVPVTNAENLIRMFDRNGDKNVSYAELVEGAVIMDEEINHRDYVKLALWLQNLMNRVQNLEERLDRLVGTMRLIRIKLQAAFEALSRTMQTADETIMRQRALKTIRDQKLPEPMKLKDPSAFVPRSMESIRSETDEFLSFARRFLGDAIPTLPDAEKNEGGPVSVPTSPEPRTAWAEADTLRGTGRAPGHGRIPSAPPQEAVWREQNEVDRDNTQFADKYVAYFGQPSPATLDLRDTINRH